MGRGKEMRNRALVFAIVVTALVVLWSLLFGGCSEEANESSPAPSPEQVPATLSLEELDRAYLRDQGVFSPTAGDGEMGSPDAFGLGRAAPEHIDLGNLFSTLPRETGDIEIVFYFYYVEVTEFELTPPPRVQEPYLDLWYCEPEEADGLRPELMPRNLWPWPGAPDDSLPTLPGTY